MEDDRKLAALVIRGVAAGARAAGAISADPLVNAMTTGAGHILSLVAKLVEEVGREKAEELLRKLVEDPAAPISKADLDADVEAVRRELGL